MSDDIGRFVLNILVAPMELHSEGKGKSYLLDTVFLPRADHSEVAGAVITTLVNWKLKFQDIITFNTDNVSYMKKVFLDVLKALMPNCTHMTCMSHIMNLFGEAFRKPFQKTNKYIKAANAIYWNSGARKARYLRYLKEEKPDKTPKLAPNPIGTRWNCWYDAVAYHKENMDVFLPFIQEELQHAKCESLTYLANLTAEDRVYLDAEMHFIQDRC